MEFRPGTMDDFPEAFSFSLIRALWTSNTYEETPTSAVY